VVVDDSAFVRKTVRNILSESAEIDVVGLARSGQDALTTVELLKPDVVVCDLLMQEMDGVEYVRQQMNRQPLPILILTASPEDSERAIEAIDAGAVDLIRKPTALANENLLQIRTELIEKVVASARAPISRVLPVPVPPKAIAPARVAANVDVVAIGLSTGGPQALRYLLPQFTADFPVPIVIVLHMPPGYTAMFAERLNRICQLNVAEARDGDAIEPGRVLLAQAGYHLLCQRTGPRKVTARLSLEPGGKPHQPSVDVLFESAAGAYGSRLLAVVMTGMGDDGKLGAAWVKGQGGTVLTEAEESCVVYGMPRAIVQSGLSDASFSLKSMAEAIINRL
jgi:two-component system chemotaxis response regulator CheB